MRCSPRRDCDVHSECPAQAVHELGMQRKFTKSISPAQRASRQEHAAAHSVALFRALMLVSVLTYCFVAWINVHSAWVEFRHHNGPVIAISAIAATIYIGAFLLISLWRLALRVVQRRFRLRDWLPDAVLASPAIVAMVIVWRGTL